MGRALLEERDSHSGTAGVDNLYGAQPLHGRNHQLTMTAMQMKSSSTLLKTQVGLSAHRSLPAQTTASRLSAARAQ